MVLTVGCGNVSSGDPAGSGGAAGEAGAGAELAGHSGAAGDGDAGKGGAIGGATGSGGVVATGGHDAHGGEGGHGGGAPQWAACEHPINGGLNQESSSCFDTCVTSDKDAIGLTIGDNFGFCIGTIATADIGTPAAPVGAHVYCRQTTGRAGQPDPKQTPNAPLCP